jgi:hypothetical protein
MCYASTRLTGCMEEYRKTLDYPKTIECSISYEKKVAPRNPVEPLLEEFYLKL